MWEKFTSSSRRVVKYAHDEAKNFRNDCVDTEHILLGLLKDENSFAVMALFLMDVNIENVRNSAIHELTVGNYDFENLNFSKRSKEVLELAYKEARMLRHTFIGSEHLLLGLLRVQDCKAAEILNENGVTYQATKKVILGMIQQSAPDFGKTPPEHGTVQFTHGQQAERTKYIDFWARSSLSMKKVFVQAHEEAARFKASMIEPKHLLLGLLKVENSTVVLALKKLGIDPELIIGDVERTLETGTWEVKNLMFTADASAYFRFAEMESRDMGTEHTGTEHLLLGFLFNLKGELAEILSRYGITYHKTREMFLGMNQT